MSVTNLEGFSGAAGVFAASISSMWRRTKEIGSVRKIGNPVALAKVMSWKLTEPVARFTRSTIKVLPSISKVDSPGIRYSLANASSESWGSSTWGAISGCSAATTVMFPLSMYRSKSVRSMLTGSCPGSLGMVYHTSSSSTWSMTIRTSGFPSKEAIR